MLTSVFQDLRLPLLGFGTMRLPTREGTIDREQLDQMIDCAMAHGVNYFDTAYPYHAGMSEVEVGRSLSRYPRESYYLADKYPGHQIVSVYDPAAIFEEQLAKCGVDYFDFYLLHNVYEGSMDVYFDPRWGIIDYFKEQKRNGRIKHLGFSTHAQTETLGRFLDAVGADMEFCQIQLNWVDWSLQDARGKVALLNKHGIPIWVMEPLRGGKLCHLAAEDEAILRSARPDEEIPAWSFRFLQDIPGVQMILSGMSSIAQMEANIASFEDPKPLSQKERTCLLEMAERMKNAIPCTACRYCTDGCPMELDIPRLIATCNDLRFLPVTNSAMWLENIPEAQLPSACIACGKCRRICPQGIDIPAVLSELSALLERVPKWRDICREREEIARKNRMK